jgi:hypothetical protein
MRLLRKLMSIRYDPLNVIEWVVSICTAFGGLYILSPLYDISVSKNGQGAFAAALSSHAIIALWGIIVFAGAILVILGLTTGRPQIKSVGWFSIMLARFFQILTTWLTVGFLPISWIYPFTVMLVICVLWWKTRLEVYRRATH